MNVRPTPAPVSVYLVDDAKPVRCRIAARLGALAGIAVVGEAEDLAAALAGLSACQPDIAIIDLRLADGNGLELIAALSRRVPRVVTVVLTNLSGPAFRAASRAAGADFFFDKTVEFDAACKTIEAIAHERRSDMSQ
ncbi:two-component system response regulator [Burkholderia singularis]|uniref:Two-component system response regulator n=1 Tax=Burkholderia singularis TaxID=1503053 RepID=A0A118DMG4_9BURK|nr:response regulator [Burkholderia singularis]KVE24874.1 two-component system response regulator [Burkholderia singularis]